MQPQYPQYPPQQYPPAAPQQYPPAAPQQYPQAPPQQYPQAPPQQYPPAAQQQTAPAPYPAQPQFAPAQYPPQPQYAPAPQQQYGPPQPAPVAGTLDQFYAQPSTGGGKSLAFEVVGTSYIGVVSRPIGNGDIQQQTDTQGRPATFRDGRPKFVMKVPLQMQPSPAYPDGIAQWFVKGADRDELVRAMAEAGAPEGPPEPGAVITVTFTGTRPSGPGMNPTKLKQVQYRRPQGAPQAAAPQSAPVVSTASGQPMVHQQPVPAPPPDNERVNGGQPPQYMPPDPNGYQAAQAPVYAVNVANGHAPAATPAPPAYAPPPPPPPPPGVPPPDLTPEQRTLLASLTGAQ